MSQLLRGREAGVNPLFAPTPAATLAYPWGDQLGSLHAEHAVRHAPGLAPHIAEIEAEAISFNQLVDRFSISVLDMLFTDTEGYDAKLLPSFPFERVRPKRILFEYKHADGTFNIGRKLGKLLIMLDELGYDIQIVDAENCLATARR